MFKSIHALIRALQDIEADETIEHTIPEYAEEFGYKESDLHEKVQRVIRLSCAILIDQHGLCNWAAIVTLKANGFTVSAGERDSFGWLSGVISTSKGRIVYGK